MTHANESERSIRIRRMFDGLSVRYDLLNRLITFGLDRSWRRKVVRATAMPEDGRLLDLGAGTGDIAMEAVRRHPKAEITAADFSLGMMKKGRERPEGEKIRWCAADALNLPFPDRTFDAVTSGYLIRNVVDPSRAFEEQLRVVKPGGLVVCLETSPPRRNLLYPFVLFHLRVMIPFLGGLMAGDRAAYTYLPDSTRAFMSPERLARTMEGAGLGPVSHEPIMLGTMTIHWGRRPKGSSLGRK